MNKQKEMYATLGEQEIKRLVGIAVREELENYLSGVGDRPKEVTSLNIVNEHGFTYDKEGSLGDINEQFVATINSIHRYKFVAGSGNRLLFFEGDLRDPKQRDGAVRKLRQLAQAANDLAGHIARNYRGKHTGVEQFVGRK